MENTKVKVLHVLGGGNRYSGIASYLYQQYKNIDHSKVHYDFCFAKENSLKMVMDDSCFKDSHFYELKDNIKNTESINYIKFYKDLKRILLLNKYDVVVVNTSVIEISFVSLMAIKKVNKNIGFISHAHNAGLFIKKNALRKKFGYFVNLFSYFCKLFVRKYSSYLFACSENAGKITFGECSVNQNNFKIINNAIDIDKFRFNLENRKRIRKEIGVNDNTIVIGNVGMLIPRKNQDYLLNIFSEIHKKIDNTELWLVGEGPDKKALEEKSKDLSIEKSVRFLGERKDINNIYSAFDAFVFPSNSEGFGIVAIEAQASGLPTFVSDGVPDDIMISNFIKKISLKTSPSIWSDEIIKTLKSSFLKRDSFVDFSNSGFDIKSETAKLAEFYVNNFKKR